MSPMRETMQIMHKLKHLVVWSLTVPRELKGESNVAEVGENKGGGRPTSHAAGRHWEHGSRGTGGTRRHLGTPAGGLGGRSGARRDSRWQARETARETCTRGASGAQRVSCKKATGPCNV